MPSGKYQRPARRRLAACDFAVCLSARRLEVLVQRLHGASAQRARTGSSCEALIHRGGQLHALSF
jgi:hypothetical protein